MGLQGFQGLDGISASTPPGSVGDPALSTQLALDSFEALWFGGQAVEIQTITVGAATNDKTYTVNFTITGGPSGSFSYTADSSTSTTEVADGLATAALNDPGLSGYLASSDNSTNVATLTGAMPGLVFTLSDSDAQLTCAQSQAAAAGTELDFGVAVAVKAASWATPGINPIVYPLSSVLTAQVQVVTVVYEAAVEYTVTVTVLGQPYTVVVIADTDSTVTAAAIVTALNTLLPAVSVLASSALGVVTLTAEVAGLPFLVDVSAGSAVSTGSIVLTSNTGLVTDDIANVFAGFAQRSMLQATVIGSDESAYQPGDTATIMQAGAIIQAIPSGQTVTAMGALWLDVTTGLPQTAAGAGRVPVPRSLAYWQSDRGNSLGVVAFRSAARPL